MTPDERRSIIRAADSGDDVVRKITTTDRGYRHQPILGPLGNLNGRRSICQTPICERTLSRWGNHTQRVLPL